MSNPHPRRDDYASDVDFWIACAIYLDELWPERAQIRERMRAWRVIDRAATVERMRELLSLDRPFTTAETDEWDALTTAYRASRRAAEGAKR